MAPHAVMRAARNSWARQRREAIAQHQLSTTGFRADAVDRDRRRPRRFAVTDFRRRTARPASPSTSATSRPSASEHEAHDPQPCRHARPADHRRGDLRRDREAALLQPGFQKLWDLDHGFLASAPDNALLLDRLRSEGKIAEQPEWRRWKENLLSRLPRRRSAGALVAPARRPHDPRRRQSAAQGRRHLGVREPDREDGPESRYNTAVRVQGETLDNLAEGVAVFGSGRRAPPVQSGLQRAVGLFEGPTSWAGRRTSRRSGAPATSWLRHSRAWAGVRRRRHRLRRGAPRPPRPDANSSTARCCATR